MLVQTAIDFHLKISNFFLLTILKTQRPFIPNNIHRKKSTQFLYYLSRILLLSVCEILRCFIGEMKDIYLFMSMRTIRIQVKLNHFHRKICVVLLILFAINHTYMLSYPFPSRKHVIILLHLHPNFHLNSSICSNNYSSFLHGENMSKKSPFGLWGERS